MPELPVGGADVIRVVSPNDQMYQAGAEDQYFDTGRSALECVRRGLDAANVPADQVRRVLDLPCGHGRVLRHLKAAFPAARFTACDLLRDGVEYCAATFGADPVHSDENPDRVAVDRDAFDLIWVGSLLTHLDAGRWSGFLDLFRRSLRPGGVVVFTAHGRRAYDWCVRGVADYGLPYWRKTAALYGYEREGFGYGGYLASDSYGISLSRPGWVFDQIARTDELRVVHFSEAAWASHQDVYACVREPGWQVGHPPTSALKYLKHRIRERVRPRGDGAAARK